jgi:hypothetical protein
MREEIRRLSGILHKESGFFFTKSIVSRNAFSVFKKFLLKIAFDFL